MKKKGFTLIELLAVIAILAVVVSITIISVNTLLTRSKKSLSDSQKGNIEAAAKTYYLKEGMDSNAYCVDVETLIKKGYIEGKEVLDPKDAEQLTGSVKITYNANQYSYKYQDKKCDFCSYIDEDNSGTINLSDVVTCGTESFYVMYNENNEVTMLSMYNLNVGTNAYTEGTLGIQNKNVFGYKEGYTQYGVVTFSNTDYWSNGNYSPAGDSDYNYVYDINSNLYPYVSSYEDYLKENGASSASAKLISYEQVNDLETNQGNPSWLYLTSYWMGSTHLSCCVRSVYSGGWHNYDDDYDSLSFGIRPVVTVSISDIK